LRKSYSFNYTKKILVKNLVLTISISTLLIACGGGSSESAPSNQATATPLAPLATLNSNNYVAAAVSAIRAFENAAPASFVSRQLVLQEPHIHRASIQKAADAHFTCVNKSTSSLKITPITSSENLNVEFKDCVYFLAYDLNGSLKIIFQQPSASDAVTAKITAFNLKTQHSESDFIEGNGDFMFDIKQISFGDTTIMKADFPNWSYNSRRHNVDESGILQNASITTEKVDVRHDFMISADLKIDFVGDLTSSVIKGERVSISTVKPLTIPSAFAHAIIFSRITNGQLMLRGANGSKALVTLTGRDIGSHTVELDTDGDGNYETKTTIGSEKTFAPW
jgi:hypothetical protein